MTRWMALLLALLLPVWAAEVPVPEGCGTDCQRCEGRGYLPCDHAWNLKVADRPPADKELDVGPLPVGTFLCSACMDLPCCKGLGWKPCPVCASAAVKELQETQMKERKAFLAERLRRVGSALGPGFIHVRTDHFDLVSNLRFQRLEVSSEAKSGAWKDGFWAEEKPKLGITDRLIKGASAHLVAHVYARRLEECYEQFSARFDPDGTAPVYGPLANGGIMGYTPLVGERCSDDKTRCSLETGVPVRMWVVLLQGTKASVLDGIAANSLTGKHRQPMAGSFFFDLFGKDGSERFQTDGAYHHYIYHSVAELLANDFAISNNEYRSTHAARGGDWRAPALDLPDWFHEGWARVQEMDRFGEAKVQCHAEVMNQDFRSGKRQDYRMELRRQMGKGKLVPFSEISRMHLDKFNALVHMQIWAITDFLKRKDPPNFPRLVERMKCLSCKLGDEKEGFAQALDEVYSMTPLALDEAWRADLADKKFD